MRFLISFCTVIRRMFIAVIVTGVISRFRFRCICCVMNREGICGVVFVSMEPRAWENQGGMVGIIKGGGFRWYCWPILVHGGYRTLLKFVVTVDIENLGVN